MFSTFIPVLIESRHYFSYLLPWEVWTNLQIKRFPLWNFDTQFECMRLLISIVTILKSTHLINIYSFCNFLSSNLFLIRLIIITCSNHCRKIYEKVSKQLNVVPQHNPLVLANQNPTIMKTRKQIADTSKMACRNNWKITLCPLTCLW